MADADLMGNGWRPIAGIQFSLETNKCLKLFEAIKLYKRTGEKIIIN